jgi:hypothetical protein
VEHQGKAMRPSWGESPEFDGKGATQVLDITNLRDGLRRGQFKI